MPQSLSKVLIHIVFSTKGRQNLIPTKELSKLHAYIAGTGRKIGGESFRVGGTENHVHIAYALPRTVTIADAVRKIKHASSHWMRQTYSNFHWQDGYGAFSVSPSHLKHLLPYIENQQNHHRTISYKTEVRAICKKYGIDYNESCLWD